MVCMDWMGDDGIMMNNRKMMNEKRRRIKPRLREYYSQYYNDNFLRDWRYIFDGVKLKDNKTLCFDGKIRPNHTLTSKKIKPNMNPNVKSLIFLTESNHNGRLGLLGGEITYYKSLEEYMKGDISKRWSDRLFFDFDVESDEVDLIKSKIKTAQNDLEGRELRDRILELKGDFRELIFEHDLLLETFEESKKLCLYLEDLGLKPYLICSGSKGFHVNLFFEEIQLQNLSQVSRLFAKSFSDKLNLNYLDWKVFDKKKAQRRLQRCQYVYHSKTDLFTIPIPNIYDYDEVLTLLKKNNRNPIDFDINEYISNNGFRDSLIKNDREFSLINDRRKRELEKKNLERKRRNKQRMKGDYKSFEDISMIDLFSSYGGEIIKEDSNKAIVRCPFHSDNNPSAVIFKDSNYFYCSSCGKSLNYYSFIAEMEGLSLDNKRAIMEKVNEIL